MGNVPRFLDFDQALRAAGVPILGISGEGPGCRIDFDPSATASQRSAANAARATFDWTARPSLTVGALAARIEAMTDANRAKLLSRIAATIILQFGLPESSGDFGPLSAATPIAPQAPPGGAP